MENLRFGLMFDCLRGNEGGKGSVMCNGQNCLYGYCISLRNLSERNTMRFTPSCVFCPLFLEEILQNLHVFLSDLVCL